MTPECKAFLSNNTPLDLSATNDVNIKGSHDDVYVPKVRIFTTVPSIAADSLTIDNAVQVSSRGATKFFYIRTQYLESFRGAGLKFLMVSKNIKLISFSSGDICAAAETIDTIENSSGSHTIVAKSIGLIDSFVGNLNIYGATVNTVNGYNGDICLYNGAKIINYKSNNHGTVRTDCP